MRDFLCPNGGQHLAFENSVCLSCGSALGFSLDERALLVITSGQDSEHGGAVDSGQYHLCANLHVAECNWLVKVKSGVSAPRTTPIAGGYDPNSAANRAGQSPRALPRYGRAGRHTPQGNPAQQPRGRRPDDHKIRIVVGSELHQTSWDRGRLMDNNRYVEIGRQVADPRAQVIAKPAR